ncbi:MAG: hypothetical protein LZF62_380192 [Nitrospira sp.]|nr:MAG: hypothetical protein LZF62_380192 [Nitrospira sp.]
MTRFVRILLLLGLLVAGVALWMLRVVERPSAQENSAAPMGSQRTGRSTLSHGGPVDGSPPGNSQRLPAGGRDESSTQSSSTTTR